MRHGQTTWKSLREKVLGLVRPLRGSSRGPIIGVLAIAGLLVAFGWAWHRWGASVTRGGTYQVSADRIEITPQPAWVHGDIRAEVVRDGSLDKLSLLDPELTRRVRQAFETHSWVSRVKMVAKWAGGRIVVDLAYRRPAIMVETEGGWWPVDTDGVLLPPADFSQKQTEDYLQVRTANHRPAGLVGTPFGDEGVRGAAKLANLLSKNWRPLGLVRILVETTRPGQGAGDSSEYTLETRLGTRIEWGRAPGDERAGEQTAVEKLRRLQRYADDHGTLDGDPRARRIDVRFGLAVRTKRR